MECVQPRTMSKMTKLEYAGVKPRRQNHQESAKWKRAKNIALQSQSRRENEFNEEDSILPILHFSGRNKRYAKFIIWTSKPLDWKKVFDQIVKYGCIGLEKVPNRL